MKKNKTKNIFDNQLMIVDDLYNFPVVFENIFVAVGYNGNQLDKVPVKKQILSKTN